MEPQDENEKWPEWYYDFLAWVEREKPDMDLQDAQKVWEAAVNSDVEWCLNAMRVNIESFNRQCVVDFSKQLMEFKFITTNGNYMINELEFKQLLGKWGLSDAQIKDVLGD